MKAYMELVNNMLLTAEVHKHTHTEEVPQYSYTQLLSIFVENIFSFQSPPLHSSTSSGVMMPQLLRCVYSSLDLKINWQWLVLSITCVLHRSHAPDTAVLTRGLSVTSSPIRSSGRFAGRWTPSAGEGKTWSRSAATRQWMSYALQLFSWYPTFCLWFCSFTKYWHNWTKTCVSGLRGCESVLPGSVPEAGNTTVLL